MRIRRLSPAAAARSNGQTAIATIARSGSANLLGAGLSALANFTLVVLVSRMWSLEIAGSLFAVTSIFLIALALSQLGVDQGLVRFIAWNGARGESGSNRQLVSQGLKVALAVSFVVMVAGLLLAESLSRLLAGESGATATHQMIMVFAIALPVAAAYELILAITRGLARMRPTILIERILRPLLQLAAVACAGWMNADAGYLALAWVAPYGVGLLCAVGSLRFIVRATPGLLDRGSSVDSRANISEFWAFTVPRGVARLAQVGLQRADIAIVVVMAGPAAGALYTAVTRFLVLGQLAGSALQQVSEPQLARLLAVKDVDGVKQVARRLTLWTVMLTWPLYLIIAVYAEFFLHLLFGPPYGAGSLSLQILAVAMLFATAMGPLDVLLLMAGRSSLSLINTTTALAVDVAGCLLLVPTMGITGAAIAWAAAIITKNVLCFVQVRRSLGIVPASRELLWVAVTLVVFFGAVPGLVHHLASVTPAVEITVLAVPAAAYIIFLWLRRRVILVGPAPRTASGPEHNQP